MLTLRIGNEFLPVPESWVFPKFVPGISNPVNFQPATFTVDFDEDTGGTTPPPATSFNDGAENDSPVHTLCVNINGC